MTEGVPALSRSVLSSLPSHLPPSDDHLPPHQTPHDAQGAHSSLNYGQCSVQGIRQHSQTQSGMFKRPKATPFPSPLTPTRPLSFPAPPLQACHQVHFFLYFLPHGRANYDVPRCAPTSSAANASWQVSVSFRSPECLLDYHFTLSTLLSPAEMVCSVFRSFRAPLLTSG